MNDPCSGCGIYPSEYFDSCICPFLRQTISSDPSQRKFFNWQTDANLLTSTWNEIREKQHLLYGNSSPLNPKRIP